MLLKAFTCLADEYQELLFWNTNYINFVPLCFNAQKISCLIGWDKQFLWKLLFVRLPAFQ